MGLLDQYTISTQALLVAGTAGLVSYMIWYHRRPRGAPPGPVRLPLIGSTMLGADPNKFGDFINNWRQKYGDIFSFYFANQ